MGVEATAEVRAESEVRAVSEVRATSLAVEAAPLGVGAYNGVGGGGSSSEGGGNNSGSGGSRYVRGSGLQLGMAAGGEVVAEVVFCLSIEGICDTRTGRAISD